ncbi:MAG: acyltransferase family protein [Lachnospiraceae bacterium]|nr:acyltransferase family protein [Erysipelotrichaceae bacterium]MBR4342430.1 acyltransferase family protein [Lachnospiraceae bacterium]
MTEAKTRKSNIEVLRLLAAIGVILLHYNNHDIGGRFKYVTKGTINEQFLIFIESLFICSVNVFVLITGYFLCRKSRVSLWKPIELLAEVSVINAGIYVAKAILLHSHFSLKELFIKLLPMNYFAIFYSVIYAFAPFTNQLLNKNKKESRDALMWLIIILFSFIPTLLTYIEHFLEINLGGMSTVGVNNIQTGYTVVHFLQMYCIGAYLKINKEKTDKINTGVILFLFLLSVLMIHITTGIYSTAARSYCNPLVIMEAATAFLLFDRMNIKYSKLLNSVAKTSFTVYLLHLNFLPHMKVSRFVNKPLYILIAHMIGCVFICLAISYICHYIYSYFAEIVFKVLRERITLDVYAEE